MPYRSYIKIYGPPLLKAFRALEGLNLGTSEVPAFLSKERQGLYDFHFEWYSEPDLTQFHRLLEKIDETLSPLGVWYTLTSVRF